MIESSELISDLPLAQFKDAVVRTGREIALQIFPLLLEYKSREEIFEARSNHAIAERAKTRMNMSNSLLVGVWNHTRVNLLHEKIAMKCAKSK